MNDLPVVEKDIFESSFWGNCCNTLGEEIKQIVYAKRMGLKFTGDWRSDYNIDMQGASVIDIGGGPVSLLLKCINLTRAYVVDPMTMPKWVHIRYADAGINFFQERAEDFRPEWGFDEAWIYNVLQHVDDPALIIKNTRNIARTVRLFEWIDIPAHPGHPHMLTEQFLIEALGPSGSTEYSTEFLNENGCLGRCFYGAFNGSDQ